jgi:hypothetical protein
LGYGAGEGNFEGVTSFSRDRFGNSWVSFGGQIWSVLDNKETYKLGGPRLQPEEFRLCSPSHSKPAFGTWELTFQSKVKMATWKEKNRLVVEKVLERTGKVWELK